jgi:N-methylhydantoinase B
VKDLIDPIRLEIIRSALIAAAEEMSTVIFRTSRSPAIREGKDHSTGIFDPLGQNLAQSARVPIHLNVMGTCLEDVLRRFIPAHTWNDGDLVIVNDPYCGAQHLPDIATFAPIFFDRQLLGFVGMLAHQVDVGGGAPGSYDMHARDIFAEGLRIPPIRLRNRGVLNQEVLDLILQNTRQPEIVRADLISQMSALSIGIENVVRLCRKYGRELLQKAAIQILDQSELAMSNAIRVLPQGTYEFDDVVDGDGVVEGRSYRIAVSLEIKGGRIKVDLSGSDDQAAGPINCTLNIAKSAVYYAIIAGIGDEIPANAGCYKLIDVVAREGSIVHCRYPAPVVSRITVGHRIVNVIMGALSKALPERIPAAYYGVSYTCILGAVMPDTSLNVMLDVEVGGWGAEPNRDGASALACGLHNARNMPLEMLEATYPVIFRTYSLRPDSGGEGKYRGGLGVIREWELNTDRGTLSLTVDRVKRGPFGLLGGKPGMPGRVVMIRRNGDEQPLPAKASGIELQRGDRLRLETSGGGGFGHPAERADESVRQDTVNGYVSRIEDR